jgi:hypothetical protein
MNESLTIRRSKSMIRELKSIIRGLKGRNKATERGEDILEKKVYGLMLITLTSGRG